MATPAGRTRRQWRGRGRCRHGEGNGQPGGRPPCASRAGPLFGSVGQLCVCFLGGLQRSGRRQRSLERRLRSTGRCRQRWQGRGDDCCSGGVSSRDGDLGSGWRGGCPGRAGCSGREEAAAAPSATAARLLTRSSLAAPLAAATHPPTHSHLRGVVSRPAGGPRGRCTE